MAHGLQYFIEYFIDIYQQVGECQPAFIWCKGGHCFIQPTQAEGRFAVRSYHSI